MYFRETIEATKRYLDTHPSDVQGYDWEVIDDDTGMVQRANDDDAVQLLDSGWRPSVSQMTPTDIQEAWQMSAFIRLVVRPIEVRINWPEYDRKPDSAYDPPATALTIYDLTFVALSHRGLMTHENVDRMYALVNECFDNGDL